MQKLYFVAFFIMISPCTAQTVGRAALAPADPSIREQIKADRDKERQAEVGTSSQPRPWDKDANGKRPWDRKDEPAK